VEDKEPHFSVHLPSSRVTLILNLIIRPQMPLAVPLAAPKRVVVACIRRLNPPCTVSTTLSRNSSILQLNVFAHWAVVAYMSRCRRHANAMAASHCMAIRHMIRRGCSSRARSGRVDVGLCRVAIARRRVVVGPLVRVIEVSKRVQRSIHVVVVVAAVRWAAGGVVTWGAVVIGTVAVVGMLGLVGTCCIYPRKVATCCDTNTHAHADSNTAVAVADTAIGDDAGWVSAVWLLAGIAEEAALAIAGRVDVSVARLWVCFHCGDEFVDEGNDLFFREWRQCAKNREQVSVGVPQSEGREYVPSGKPDDSAEAMEPKA
jgi:hypothetical protein